MAEMMLARPSRAIVVVESAGQCHALTAARREAMGPVVRLDPFAVLGQTSDQFNPLDVLRAEEALVGAESFRFAELIIPPDPATARADVDVGGPAH